jgi:lysophospholipase L1-like esterase
MSVLSACAGRVALYSVAYDGNGSTGGSVPVDATKYEKGRTVTVLGNTGGLTKPDYSFAGWNTRADGTGTTYTPGQTFTMGAADATLYGKWVFETTGPTVTAVAATNVSSTSALITWTTNVPATSQVEYGLTTSYGQATAVEAALLVAHAVLLSGLTPASTYDYRVRSKDAAGNEGFGAAASFRTADNPDITPFRAVPMPLISRFPGVHAFASNDLDGTLGDFGANRGRDDVYGGWGHYWRTLDLPYPVWIAYDLSSVPDQQRSQVLVAWYNESDGYNNAADSTNPLAYNEPADYTLEGNAASGSATDAPTDGWVTLLSVTGNTYHSRSNTLSLAGYNWIRFHATAGAPTNQPENTDCELKLEVYDAHQGNTDSWAFLGDSVTNDGMNHLENGDLNFAQRINATVTANFPMYENAGMPFDGALSTGALRLQALLENSVARYIGLSYGTNDAPAGVPTDYTFYNAYKALVDDVLAAGRIPVIPTISWTAEEPWQTNIGDPVTGPEFCLNRQLAKLKADYRAAGKAIFDGPDLWAYFKANPTQIASGEIHPTADGYIAMRNLWAAAAIANFYQP